MHSGYCEWFCRPEVALSEMSETLETNLSLLTDIRSNLFNEEIIEQLQRKLGPLVQALKPFNRRRHQNDNPDIKQMLKCMWDTQLNHFIAQAYQICSALFLTTLHYSVQNPDEQPTKVRRKNKVHWPRRYSIPNQPECGYPESLSNPKHLKTV